MLVKVLGIPAKAFACLGYPNRSGSSGWDRQEIRSLNQVRVLLRPLAGIPSTLTSMSHVWFEIISSQKALCPGVHEHPASLA